MEGSAPSYLPGLRRTSVSLPRPPNDPAKEQAAGDGAAADGLVLQDGIAQEVAEVKMNSVCV